MCSKNHILQLKLSDQLFKDLIFYTPSPRGIGLTQVEIRTDIEGLSRFSHHRAFYIVSHFDFIRSFVVDLIRVIFRIRTKKRGGGCSVLVWVCENVCGVHMCTTLL